MQMMLAQGYVSESIGSILFFTFLALLLNSFARSRNFFFIPYTLHGKKTPQPTFVNVACCFGIYLGFSTIFAPLMAHLIRMLSSAATNQNRAPMLAMSALQLTTTLAILLALFFYCKRQDRQTMKVIIKNYSLPTAIAPWKDFLSGAIVWILGFPVVAAVGQIFDVIVYLIFGMQSYEQVAVRYLKMTLGSMPMLFIALFSIIIAAPIIEEFLFRGMLQSWLKSRLGTKAAILLSSLAFSLFHVAASQGLGNISLVASLFSFACFLGFIYEKHASLFASIGLHMTFNTISTLRILFFSES